MLDHKELDYVAHNLIPGFHRAFAQLKTGQNLLPILKDDHRWIAESTKIALYLDDTYRNMHFYAVMNNLDSKPKIDSLADELGVHVRRWALAHTLAQVIML